MSSPQQLALSTSPITIVRDRYAKGWPRHADGERAYVLGLGEALTRTYRSDAHFVQYATPNDRRLTREAFDEGVIVRMNVIVFDVDCADTHGSSQPAPERWRAELGTKVEALSEAHPAPYFYETRGGARIVYRVGAPFEITSQAGAREWSQHYAIALAYLSRQFGIGADPACHDWQRLFRLPFATRDKGAKPEAWPTRGDAHKIGTLQIPASAADVDAARASSKAFSTSRISALTPCTSSGEGLLFHLLRARGDVLREHTQPGAYVIRCPREFEHSTGRTGDGSSLLYSPAAGEEVGAIHCLHNHCAHMTVRDWVRCFGQIEIDDARRAAGMARVA